MKKESVLRITVIVLTLLILASCSSAPRGSGDVFHLRIQAEMHLDNGNREAARGNYDSALYLLSECKRSAILTDDSSLIIRSSLSRGNVLFLLGRIDEAFAEWEQAIEEAQRLPGSELLHVSRVYYARGAFLSGRVSAQSVFDEVNREAANISSRLYLAFSWQVRGLALRALGRYIEAEEAVMNSLEIHERGRHLESASFDWYTIASIRSLAGNTQGALQALEASIAIDRRIENSWGLGAGWRAMGDVYHRAGREREALFAYNRAMAIFAAIGSDFEVQEINRRIANQER